MSKPDPDGQPDRRKLWVDRANFREPPPLGCTIGENGVSFDHNRRPTPNRPGPALAARPRPATRPSRS